jgi:hypothetical protein
LDIHTPEGRRIVVEQDVLEDAQQMDWEGAEHAQDILEARATTEEVRTQLTAYFEFNLQRQQSGLPPLGLTYATAYKKLRYVRTTKKWQLYKTTDESREGTKLNRIKGVSPINFELLVIIEN